MLLFEETAYKNSVEILPALLAYIFLWCFTALIAEDDAAQLVFKIVSTFTTIIAILGNILFPLATVQISSVVLVDGMRNETVFLILFNLFILPLVVAGYFALLSKEMQIYLRKKYLPAAQNE